MNIGNAIYKALRSNKAGRGWESLVGYTLDDLMGHLGKQFDDKMTWNNYGPYWHIDHRIPKSWFEYSSPQDLAFKECWALKNLQPKEAFANLGKGNRFID